MTENNQVNPFHELNKSEDVRKPFVFQIPNEFEKFKKERHEKQYFKHHGEKVHVTDFEDKSITKDMLTDMRMNSYANEIMPPKLDDEALIEKAEHYIAQCTQSRYPCSTYDEALIHTILPELIKRLKAETGGQ